MSEEQEVKNPKKGGLKRFFTMQAGQILSLLGSGLTNFALAIWVFQGTESVTQYVLITVIAGLPGLMIGPFAGALVDRWNRKAVLIVTDSIQALCTLAIAILFHFDVLAVWHIYITAAIGAMTAAFQWPAYIAAVTTMLDKKHYARAQGVIAFGQSGTLIAAPILAGALMTVTDLRGIITIDFITFFFAIGALLLIKIPNPPRQPVPQGTKPSLWNEAVYGWTFIKERQGLLSLLTFFAIINLVVSMATITVFPMVFSFGGKVAAGTAMSFGAAGMMLGGMFLTATGGPKKKINGVLGYTLLISVSFFMLGLKPSLWLVCAAALIFQFTLPIINGCSQAIWMTKVPQGLLGRVFAVRRLIAQFTVPLGDFAAGPLSDMLFEPRMGEGGSFATAFGGLVGRVVGVGPGRGIGLMIICLAIFPMLIGLWGYLNPHVRNVETELIDADVLAKQEAEAKAKAEEEAKAAEGADNDQPADESKAEGEAQT